MKRQKDPSIRRRFSETHQKLNFEPLEQRTLMAADAAAFEAEPMAWDNTWWEDTGWQDAWWQDAGWEATTPRDIDSSAFSPDAAGSVADGQMSADSSSGFEDSTPSVEDPAASLEIAAADEPGNVTDSADSSGTIIEPAVVEPVDPVSVVEPAGKDVVVEDGVVPDVGVEEPVIDVDTPTPVVMSDPLPPTSSDGEVTEVPVPTPTPDGGVAEARDDTGETNLPGRRGESDPVAAETADMTAAETNPVPTGLGDKAIVSSTSVPTMTDGVVAPSITRSRTPLFSGWFSGFTNWGGSSDAADFGDSGFGSDGRSRRRLRSWMRPGS